MTHEAMTQWLQQQLAAEQTRGEALKADGRTDEGIFHLIRANIFDVFKTVLAAAPDAVFFEDRLRTIPAAWRKACEAALAHGDTLRLKQESLKLEAAEEIRQAWEVRK